MKQLPRFPTVVLAAALALGTAGAAFARPTPPAPKLVCAITKETVTKPDPKLSSVYKGKTFYFCCDGCKPAFDKMSDTQKTALLKYGVDTKKATATTKPAAPAAKPADAGKPAA